MGYQWHLPDSTPPSVAGHSPASGATDVATDAPVVVTFDEEISPLGFTLTATPAPDGWALTWNEAGTVVTATNNGLAGLTSYTISVQATDVNGNAMIAPDEWSFTTTEGAYFIYLPTVLRSQP